MAEPRKARRPADRRHGLPSRDQILAYVAASPGKTGRRDIARAFGVTGPDRMALKTLLREMGREGLLPGAGNGPGRGKLAPVGVADVVGVDNDGVVTVRPIRDGADLAPIVLKGLNGARLPALAAGDRVLARFVEIEGRDGEPVGYEARVIRRLPSRARRMIGVVTGGRGRQWLTPASRNGRNSGDDLPVAPGPVAAEPGELVTAELVEGARREAPSVRIVERHGSADAPGSVSLIAIAEHAIPYEFPAEALAEAARATAPGPQGRTDLRHIPFVTIDPADARDHDDAVHAAADPSPTNPGGFVVTVAIADVAHFVRPGSALDREALARGNSVYFPDRVVPMLPEALSADLCSLKPGVDRPALAVTLTFDAAGSMKRHGFKRALIRSRAKLSYVEAQAAIDGHAADRTAALTDEVLRPLWDAYRVLAEARRRREPLELDLPERRIILDDAGDPIAVTTPPRLDAHRLIEEFMIQANVATAETLDHRKSPFLRRVHDAPAPEKIEALAAYLLSLEMRLPRGQTLAPGHFNRLIALAADTPHSQAVSDAVLRAQAQAHYAPADLGHFGLNLRRYAHFTSPIRRYADLIAHRALITALALGPDGLDRGTIAALDEIGSRISEAERRAMAAERATADRLIARFLASRIGATFEGRVRGIVRTGLFVELDDTGASGFVAAAGLSRAFADRFDADDGGRSMTGASSGSGYRLGDRVEVRLAEADPLRGELEFEMLSPPHAVADATSGPGRHRRRRGRTSRGR